MLKLGIVGLPNVGKSTLFNALTAAHADAANYPFCTVEPNVGMVEVPDARLARLAAIVSPQAHRAGRRAVRRHRGSRAGCGRGRRAGQQVSRQHPRDRRDRARRPLLRGSRCHARDGRGRSRARPRGDRSRAGACRIWRRWRSGSTGCGAPPAPTTRRRWRSSPRSRRRMPRSRAGRALRSERARRGRPGDAVRIGSPHGEAGALRGQRHGRRAVGSRGTAPARVAGGGGRSRASVRRSCRSQPRSSPSSRSSRPPTAPISSHRSASNRRDSIA